MVKKHRSALSDMSWPKMIWNLTTKFVFKKNKFIKDWYQLKTESGKDITGYRNKKKEIFKLRKKMPWNIYTPGMPIGEHIKKFHKVNIVLKLKLFYPILFIAKKALGKFMDTKVDDQWHNKNLKIFDEQFEKSLEEWYRYYLSYVKGADVSKMTLKQIKKNMKPFYDPDNRYRLAKNIFLSMVMTDTATREFMNIFMHNLARGMVSEYKGQRVAHLFYNSKDVYDMDYYVLGSYIDKARKGVVTEPVNIGSPDGSVKELKNLKMRIKLEPAED